MLGYQNRLLFILRKSVTRIILLLFPHVGAMTPQYAQALGSSPRRLTSSYGRQNLQNDLQSISAFLDVLRAVFKNLSPFQDS